ncbi:hypothetical protein KI387_032453, partial [Taxus chinensis]
MEESLGRNPHGSPLKPCVTENDGHEADTIKVWNNININRKDVATITTFNTLRKEDRVAFIEDLKARVEQRSSCHSRLPDLVHQKPLPDQFGGSGEGVSGGSQ